MNTRLLFVHALSPLHAGTGQSFGAIDLAIARDRATNHPYLPGTSIKGSLRSRAFADAEQGTTGKATAIFGPDAANASQHAGAVAFGDANLLLMPVRSVKGTFAWVTSPLLLARFSRDAREAGVPISASLPKAPADPQECQTAEKSHLVNGQTVYLEDLDLKTQTDTIDAWGKALGRLLFPNDDFWQEHLLKHLCVVHDDVMSFLSQYGTDVVTRNVLKPDTKTVDNLWDEENLPAESVLYAMLLATPNKGTDKAFGGPATPGTLFAALQSHLSGTVQLGGKATVGRGRCRLVLQGGAR